MCNTNRGNRDHRNLQNPQKFRTGPLIRLMIKATVSNCASTMGDYAESNMADDTYQAIIAAFASDVRQWTRAVFAFTEIRLESAQLSTTFTSG